MKYRISIAMLLVSTLTMPQIVSAQEFEVGQQNKRFTVKHLAIKVGDQVKFTNQDPYFHNVFSLSETKQFDLGSYNKGEYKSVTFEKSGVVEVECAIHPSMHLKIEVK